MYIMCMGQMAQIIEDFSHNCNTYVDVDSVDVVGLVARPGVQVGPVDVTCGEQKQVLS